MPKRFEPEVSKSLDRAGVVWKHKCPDNRFTDPNKVDFHGIMPDGSGRAFALEAKETTNKETLPWKDVTPNQREVLRLHNSDGALGLLIVNFHRSHDPSIRRAGVVGIYRWPFQGELELAHPKFEGFAALKEPGAKLKLSWADIVIDERQVGLWWDLSSALRSQSWGW